MMIPNIKLDKIPERCSNSDVPTVITTARMTVARKDILIFRFSVKKIRANPTDPQMMIDSRRSNNG